MVHYTSLNENHHVGPARLINERDLRWHLGWDHGVDHKSVKTKAQLGRLHMLVHAVLAHQDLEQLLNLPRGYGSGMHIQDSD